MRKLSTLTQEVKLPTYIWQVTSLNLVLTGVLGGFSHFLQANTGIMP
jgi:hypothetical protein